MAAQMSRRSTLKVAGTAAGAVVVGAAVRAIAASAADAAFAHPGLPHTKADLGRVAAKVKAGTAAYRAGFARLTANAHTQSTWWRLPAADGPGAAGVAVATRLLERNISRHHRGGTAGVSG